MRKHEIQKNSQYQTAFPKLRRPENLRNKPKFKESLVEENPELHKKPKKHRPQKNQNNQ